MMEETPQLHFRSRRELADTPAMAAVPAREVDRPAVPLQAGQMVPLLFLVADFTTQQRISQAGLTAVFADGAPAVVAAGRAFDSSVAIIEDAVGADVGAAIGRFCGEIRSVRRSDLAGSFSRRELIDLAMGAKRKREKRSPLARAVADFEAGVRL